MANTQSAYKRIEIAERNKLRNKAYKSMVKTLVKKTLVAISDSNGNTTELIEKFVSLTYSKIDKAVQKGIIHANTGNSKKSFIARELKKSLTVHKN
uniref:Ribosomal protein S20 n=1 Tax=Cryptomonas sp. SAG 977-2f TaxID=279061 RepID=A0A679CBW4_9CRYP|nr:ribosomal protein S20 [Cryptomonas sp. SAG 977-2f]